jgi:hypothetical protein
MTTTSCGPEHHLLQNKFDFVQHQLDRCTGYEKFACTGNFTLTSPATQARDPVCVTIVGETLILPMVKLTRDFSLEDEMRGDNSRNFTRKGLKAIVRDPVVNRKQPSAELNTLDSS